MTSISPPAASMRFLRSAPRSPPRSPRPEFAEYTAAGPGFVGGIFGFGTGAGLRKTDTKLKEMLNAAIDSAIADGTIKRISEKWVGVDVTPVK